MAYTVLLTNFEGPLELLLRLIEREQMDITEVAISKVTNDYLEHINHLTTEPDELNWFLELAGKLVNIKSQALLPQTEVVEEESNMTDLGQQLETYRIFRNLAREFDALSQKPTTPRPYLKNSVNQSLPPANLTLDNLATAYLNHLQAIEERKTSAPKIIFNKVNLRQVVKKLELELSRSDGQDLSYILSNAASTHEAVLYFLAVLELHKSNRLTITRTDNGVEGKIILELVNG